MYTTRESIPPRISREVQDLCSTRGTINDQLLPLRAAAAYYTLRAPLSALDPRVAATRAASVKGA